MRFSHYVFGSTCPGRINSKHLYTVIHHISYSDWIFLYYLAKNMEPYVFCDLLADLASEFRENYVEELQTLRADERETLRVDDIGEKSVAASKESIDEVDLRRK